MRIAPAAGRRTRATSWNSCPKPFPDDELLGLANGGEPLICAQMPDIAAVPHRLRVQIRELLPEGASLRRAKDGWLFSSDALFRLAQAAPGAISPSARRAGGGAISPAASSEGRMCPHSCGALVQSPDAAKAAACPQVLQTDADGAGPSLYSMDLGSARRSPRPVDGARFSLHSMESDGARRSPHLADGDGAGRSSCSADGDGAGRLLRLAGAGDAFCPATSDGRSRPLPGEGALSAGQSFDALSAAIARAGFTAPPCRDATDAPPERNGWRVEAARHARPPDFFALDGALLAERCPARGRWSCSADGLRLIESGDANERRAYLVRARQFAAVSLRTGGGAGYGVALLAAG